MMRKDVKLGFAIGGVLLAVVVVYILVGTGNSERKRLAENGPGVVTEEVANGGATNGGAANGGTTGNAAANNPADIKKETDHPAQPAPSIPQFGVAGSSGSPADS